MPAPNLPQKGLNILCIDGGGVRGLSALIILDEIMTRMRHSSEHGISANPYEYFDVIAGTGTGAIQACMLGRLRMSTKSAIECYASLANNVFSQKNWLGRTFFKISKLRESLRKIIQHETGDPDEPMMERLSDENRCKTMVFAIPSEASLASIPVIFGSYPGIINAGPDCTIWQTLCATIAHPDLSGPFEIGDPPLQWSFVEAGFGCNNPLHHVLTEVARLYPGRHISSVLSIGTGKADTIQFLGPTGLLRHFLPTKAVAATKKIAMDAERVGQEAEVKFSRTDGIYFRFNVDQMQSVEIDQWERLNQVAECARSYMMLAEVSQRIDKAIQAIQARRLAIPTVGIDGQLQITKTEWPAAIYYRDPTPDYTGREAEISKVEMCICGSDYERKICVIHGAGGTGKTQLGLKLLRSNSQ
ncbi:unnamed protein product [Rhizoctonia solani]|uniref:PNPLA domain-containing protein n=1 Tax=Rhizoctonia solani TaxID=456999 RepID=A0A8H2WEY3_9AGAM|nr:unnamed protein product [Rhizoctonia solani]